MCRRYNGVRRTSENGATLPVKLSPCWHGGSCPDPDMRPASGWALQNGSVTADARLALFVQGLWSIRGGSVELRRFRQLSSGRKDVWFPSSPDRTCPLS